VLDQATRSIVRSARSRLRATPAAALFAACTVAAQARAQVLEFVDVDNAGAQMGGYACAVSRNGRFVVFTALNAAQTTANVFLRDRQAHTTKQVDLAGASTQPNDWSDTVWVHGASSDGRFVLFMSYASNLVPGDTNGFNDLFVRDVLNSTTVRASVGNAGQQGNAPTILGGSWQAVMSDDGRYVAFTSGANNLVPGDTNGSPDVFRFDRTTGTSVLVSVSTGGGVGNGWSSSPSMSADGRFIAFDSLATNLVAGDANGAIDDTFVRDMNLGSTVLVSLSSTGAQGFNFGAGDSAISDDGRYVAFASFDQFTPQVINWTAIYVRDRVLQKTTLISPASVDNNCAQPEISGDGSRITFQSMASNLAPGHHVNVVDTYLCDRATSTVARISNGTSGDGSDLGADGSAVLSFDGSVVVFADTGNNLIVPDTKPNTDDVFLWHCALSGGGSGPTAYCIGKTTPLGCTPVMSFSGTPGSCSGFDLVATGVNNEKSGFLAYSLAGPASWSISFGGWSTLYCLKFPMARCGFGNSQGTPKSVANDCSGSLSADFNLYASSGADPALLVPGVPVFAQWFVRESPSTDPNSGKLTSTNAVHFTL
jgi:Tol biopolymer transport system component